jgi:ABC-type polar amino acid transport system ATPase subunit
MDKEIRTMNSIVRVSNLHKYFNKLHVLKGINFHVDRNECIVIVGPSGGGKSTLLQCLNCLEPIQKGEIMIGETLITPNIMKKHNVAKIRSMIGIVFQQFNLFPHLSVLRNITLGPEIVKKISPKEAEQSGRDLLKKFGLSDKIDSYPNDCSGGQQQRIAIARSLMMKPEILLFDEITSALDPELVGEVIKTMEQLAHEGTTMIVVTHEIGFAREAADRIVFIDDGKIYEEGTPEKMIEHPEKERTKNFFSRVLR